METNADRCFDLSFDDFLESVSYTKGDKDHAVGDQSSTDSDLDSKEHHESNLSVSVSRPSRRFNDSNTTTLNTTEPTKATPDFQINLLIFIELLSSSDLLGLVVLLGNNTKIGEGGQFVVYMQTASVPGYKHNAFASKRLKFPGATDQRFTLYDRRAERHLYHAYLEIRALTHEKLESHPNIVRLLAWAVERDDWRQYPVFLFELATSDLFQFLQEDKQASLETKCNLCRDVASGIDVIHDCDISHGDLKPANILLFFEGHRPIAKLSDFGFSQEANNHFFGGTLGWQAPEAMKGSVRPYNAQIADIYSYGLLLWSVFFLKGSVPRYSTHDELTHLVFNLTESYISIEAKKSQIFRNLQTSIIETTRLDPPGRPRKLGTLPLFKDFVSLEYSCDKLAEQSRDETTESLIFSWDVVPVSHELIGMVLPHFREMRGRNDLDSSRLLFPAFLQHTAGLPKGVTHEESTLFLLQTCANEGHAVARGVFFKVFQFYGVQPSSSLGDLQSKYLQDAVTTGSVAARNELQDVDSRALVWALHTFRDWGGYFMMYADIDKMPVPGSEDYEEVMQTEGGGCYNMLHWISARGSAEELSRHLQTIPHGEIDARTMWGDTAVQIAFMRGDSEVVKTLLLFGADPTITHGRLGSSCLHWIFNFDREAQADILALAIDHGARLDSISSSVPFFHFPFSLPKGTPLHWAVALSCHETTDLLLRSGADPLLRNMADPYAYDMQVRILDQNDGIDEDPYSLPARPPQGLTALDLAAIHRDIYIFEWLIKNKVEIEINDRDEMGFTAVHRLAADSVWRTSGYSRFGCRPFQPRRDQTDLVCILQALLRLGADLQALTGRSESRLQNYTTLMLAVGQCDADLTEALLKCNVDPNQENSYGVTAIMQAVSKYSTDKDEHLACIKALVAHGACIHHRSASGFSALEMATGTRQLDVLEYLLEQGADITQRKSERSAAEHDDSVLSSLPFGNNELSEEYDRHVASILKKYLFSRQDPNLDDIIRRGNSAGRTLLHRFAEFGMENCVRLFIFHGVDINARRRTDKFFKKGEGFDIVPWQMTPLDDIIGKLTTIRTNMRDGNSYSPGDYETKVRHYEDVIKLLRTHGAIEVNSAVS